MKVRMLVGFVVFAASAAAACGGEDPTLVRDARVLEREAEAKSDDPTKPRPAPGTTTTPEPGKLEAGSKEGEKFFASDVYAVLKAKCAGCHVKGGAGTPTWIDATDAKKTYDMLYLQAYVTAGSRIVAKGLHSNGGAPELTAADKGKWQQWITMESKEPGKPAQVNVLEKFGNCFDQAKFDAIGFGNLRVTRRTVDNNAGGFQEDEEKCTGCKQNTPCNRCHSGDDVTGFVMAIGNNTFSPDYTFQETKKLSPPFIRQYVGTTPTGEPTFNAGIMTKSTYTIEKTKAYQHPMFIVSPKMEASIKAFVDSAIEKHRAGTCGK